MGGFYGHHVYHGQSAAEALCLLPTELFTSPLQILPAGLPLESPLQLTGRGTPKF